MLWRVMTTSNSMTGCDRELRCPFARELDAYLKGKLRGFGREAFEHHCSGCFDCKKAVEAGSRILDFASSRARRLSGAGASGKRLTRPVMTFDLEIVCAFDQKRMPERYLLGDLNEIEEAEYIRH